MAYLNPDVLDNGLITLTNDATRLDLCSQPPSSFTEATTTYSLGNKTGITVSSPTDGVPTGRRVTVSPITDGNITADGVATYYALTDTTNNLLLAWRSVQNPQSVTNGNIFTTASVDITIPDPA